MNDPFRTLRRNAAAVLALLLVSGCEQNRAPNLLLISIDTLRADRLGCYGNSTPTSPNLDAFAAGHAVLFETAVAAAPSTLPSHASLFTSLLPSRHGALFTRGAALADEQLTLAEILKGRGYRTLSVNDGGQVDAKFGVSQGFDNYSTLPGVAAAAKFARTVAAAFALLDQEAGKQPWFLFLHTYETHHPYTPDARYLDAIGHRYEGSLPAAISKELLEEINDGRRTVDDADRDHVIATYDAEIRSTDEALGTLLQGLEARGLLKDTLVVITSDHGEELGEHGRLGWHSHALWDPLLLVPLLIAFPDGSHAGRRISDQVRGIDVMPTVLELAGIPVPAQLQGRSLMPLLRGEADDARPAVSQQDSVAPVLPASLRVDGRKLYVRGPARPPLLFDLRADRREIHDLFASDAKVAEDLGAELSALLQAGEGKEPAAAPAELDPVLREKLRSLGYAEPGGGAHP